MWREYTTRRCKSYRVHVNIQEADAPSKGAYMSTDAIRSNGNRDEELSIAQRRVSVRAVRGWITAVSELGIHGRSYKYPKERYHHPHLPRSSPSQAKNPQWLGKVFQISRCLNHLTCLAVGRVFKAEQHPKKSPGLTVFSGLYPFFWFITRILFR